MNYYYSGQGSLYVGERDANGQPKGLLPVGNVPTLEISIEIEKFEHKEAETGNRSTDLTIIQELNGTFNAVLESITSANLALGFFGTSATVAGAVVAAEDILIETEEVIYPLANINIDDSVEPTCEDSLAASLTLDTDFEVDYANGTVKLLAAYGGSLPETFTFGYTFLSQLKMSAFTKTTIERYLRFQGLNTATEASDPVVVDIFKASIDPAQNYGLINEEVASLTLTGNILQDSLNASKGSEFFIERRTGSL